MHILIMNWRDPKNPKAGGAEIVTFEHALRWARAGHKVTWVSASSSGLVKEEVVKGVHFVRRGGSFSVYLAAPFYFLRHAQDFSVIVDEIHGLPFFTPLYTKKPKVAFIHEIAKEIWEYNVPFPLSVIGRFLESIYLFLYRNVLFWTDAQSTVDDLVAAGVPRSHCVAIPCPVSNPIVRSLPKKEKKPTFLYVSRLIKMKGIESVLTAFSYIKKELPEAQMWVIGDGSPAYIAQLKMQVRNLGLEDSVMFMGKTSEKEKLMYMRRAHMLLHASIREGWGLVVLEAASQGTPSVVYNVPGLRDTVKNGKTGVVVRENTPEVLAAEAVSLCKDAQRYLVLQNGALRWVRSLFWNDVAQKSLDLLTLVAS